MPSRRTLRKTVVIDETIDRAIRLFWGKCLSKGMNIDTYSQAMNELFKRLFLHVAGKKDLNTDAIIVALNKILDLEQAKRARCEP